MKMTRQGVTLAAHVFAQRNISSDTPPKTPVKNYYKRNRY